MGLRSLSGQGRLTGTASLCNISYSSLLTSFVKEISNNTVSEEEKQERKRETNIKKTIKRSRRVGFNHHQSKTPTLASEQRNARHLNHHVGCPQKWPDCRPVAS